MIKTVALYLGIFALCASSNGYAVEFGLFGDTTLVKSNDGSRFDLGSVDLTAEQNISDTSYVTVELLFEFEEHEFVTEVSRFSINRALTDNTDIYMGKFTNGLGIWHQTFHHGSLALDTVSLPFFIGETDGRHGLIPAHLVGAGMTGHIRSLEYQLAVVNNPGFSTANVTFGELSVHAKDREAPGSNFGTITKLSYEFNRKSRFGLMLQTRNIMEYSNSNSGGANIERGDSLFDQQQLGFDFMYVGKHFSTYLEYYKLTTEDNPNLDFADVGNPPSVVSVNEDSYEANMFYIQMGWRFNNRWSFSVRHEGLDYDSNSTLFDWMGVEKQTRDILSFNYRLDESNALRLEGKQVKYDTDNNQIGVLEDDTVYSLQWFFLLL